MTNTPEKIDFYLHGRGMSVGQIGQLVFRDTFDDNFLFCAVVGGTVDLNNQKMESSTDRSRDCSYSGQFT